MRTISVRKTLALCLGLIQLYACTAPGTGPAASEPAAATLAPPTATRPAPPVLGSFDPASVTAIRLEDYPVVPEIGPAAVAIYQAGLARGNNPRVFSRLGDCMTENPYFLVTFDDGDYDLGDYGHLQAVLDQFSNAPAPEGDATIDSFARIGLAAASGFNVAGPLDATWANPEWCQGGESPLACEYRVANPSLALIMFGTNDVTYTEPDTYDYFLRTVVEQTLERDILPLLSTFPTRLEDPAKSLLLNQIVVRVALDYGLPLINLSRALEPLPNHGIDPADPIHLSVPADGQVDTFTPENLQAGFTVRNLVTLQTLAAVLVAAK
jgi:hypothetical protein